MEDSPQEKEIEHQNLIDVYVLFLNTWHLSIVVGKFKSLRYKRCSLAAKNDSSGNCSKIYFGAAVKRGFCKNNTTEKLSCSIFGSSSENLLTNMHDAS